ncbi:DUF1772 domain-containing protein [Aurantiacibacter sp. MUD11]|uniref:anthrone oxygenase family protein n=1 Tax=Aurantiacibacter sp. MUD11 TaxID=3003265 RepID=UPI0022AA96BC|nr:anthrone oxygenase family protein [Aurantiacibacter sp. MUD11]WAT17646.1 DUF1772 domain-containing protein [Aurantiacibacter sp. MUD11]
MELIVDGLLWFSVLSTGIMAGVYFTFTTFAMRSFAELGDEAGMRAMQSINRVILRSPFLPLFFLSTLACAALVVLGLLGLARDDPWAMVAGAATYVLGMFAVTAAGNVPLNNQLDAADPVTEQGRAVWRDYLVRWTRLNHVRTVACCVAMVMLVWSMN